MRPLLHWWRWFTNPFYRRLYRQIRSYPTKRDEEDFIDHLARCDEPVPGKPGIVRWKRYSGPLIEPDETPIREQFDRDFTNVLRANVEQQFEETIENYAIRDLEGNIIMPEPTPTCPYCGHELEEDEE